jgi:hypothetical protein
MMFRTLIVVVTLTGLAFATRAFGQGSDVYNPANYPFHYDALYAELFWRCKTPDVGGVRVEGYAMSSRGDAISKFEVRLIARDAKGKKLADRSAHGKSLHTTQYKPVPFEVSVPAGGEKVRHDLIYSFEVPSEERTSRDQFGSVEDACGARWRRQAK